VEGAKSVQELLRSDFDCLTLVCTDAFKTDNEVFVSSFSGELILAREKELQEISEYKTNDAVLAVARMKENKWTEMGDTEFALVLDDIRDPGNLGTIVRTADWFGVSKIVASAETADFYNSKVIQASMGSFTRVEMFYTDLTRFLDNTDRSVIGTFLDGVDIHNFQFPKSGLIIIGNEATGISPEGRRPGRRW
jgi:TrmH family RNA methyltransferase